jgi:hypothetical protein
MPHLTFKTFHALVFGAALLVCGSLVGPLRAQDGKPAGLEVAFEWRYSCPNGKGCSFSCPGQGGPSSVTGTGGASNVTYPGAGGASNVTNPRLGGASNVTRLVIQLGTFPLGGTQKAFGIFYEFATVQIPRANGFSLTTGISTLACQVQGMNLDYYSGATDTPTASPPAAVR